MKANFGRLMLQTAQKFGKKEAIVNVERNRRYSFNELHLLTNKICNMMHDEFGMDFGDIFVTLLENDNMSLFTAWMAKGKASGAWLNYRDSMDEHMWQIDLLKPKLLVMETVQLENYHEALRNKGIQIICMDEPSEKLEGVFYFWDLIKNARDDETEVEYDIETHPFVYRFTGGTTGTGKCASYNFKNFLASVDQMFASPEAIIENDTRHLHLAPISHGSGIFIMPTFFKGGTTITMNIPDLKHMCEVIQAEKVTSTFLVPTLLYWMIDADLDKLYDLKSLKTVVYGASPMSPAKLMELKKRFGNIFVQAYGATEALPPTMILSKEAHEIKTPEDEQALSSAGIPLPLVEVKICDDQGNELKDSETGEIWIRSSGVINGYYQNPEQTAQEFENGFWKSGDLGYRDNKGNIYIVDRKKDMIITGGFNVYAIEVENSLNSHPEVQQSAVVGIPHEEWGEAVHGEIVLMQGSSLREEELVTFCKEKIGRYKAPKSISFVDQLPVSVVGKVIRREVRQKYWEGKERKLS